MSGVYCCPLGGKHMKGKRFDPAPVLARLKDFQQCTAEVVFQRLYLDNPPARRFLVADEVASARLWWRGV